MHHCLKWVVIVTLGLTTTAHWARGQETVFETTSPYHSIKVVDQDDLRILHFNNSTQSQISTKDPLQGHFEYTEYFHMPWLWNDRIANVLMIGLGGSSIQRAYQAYWPEVASVTVELDPKVVEVARDYFHFQQTEKMKAVVGDGRMYLRRTTKKYDLILLDAYTANRYGSYIPYTLVTKEFFALAHDHLTDQGILAYNVIGNIETRRENIVGAMYKTLKTSFAQVYMFPARSSFNVVFVATKSTERVKRSQLEQRLEALVKANKVTFPNFEDRLKQFKPKPPRSVDQSTVLTDDFAPVDGLLRTE
jgi:spermidine synthase